MLIINLSGRTVELGLSESAETPQPGSSSCVTVSGCLHWVFSWLILHFQSVLWFLITVQSESPAHLFATLLFFWLVCVFNSFSLNCSMLRFLKFVQNQLEAKIHFHQFHGFQARLIQTVWTSTETRASSESQARFQLCCSDCHNQQPLVLCCPHTPFHRLSLLCQLIPMENYMNCNVNKI